MKKTLFIPYQMAILAKQKGFNEPCLAFFTGNNEQIQIDDSFVTTNSQLTRIHKIRTRGGEVERLLIAAPIYQQLIDWFRQTHKIYIYVTVGSEYLQIWGVFTNYEAKKGYDVDYYEALTHALNAAFELI